MRKELDAELALDVNAQLAEGPVWDDATGTLIWVDIMSCAVHRFDPATGSDRAVDVGQPVGAAVPRRDDRSLVLALRDGFGLLEDSSNQVEMIAEVEADVPTNRMNDGKCDPLGRFWAGTMGFNEGRGVGALYRLDPDLEVHYMFSDVSISNGMDWTDDGRQMYYIDSRTHGVDVFEFDMQRGALGERRRLITLQPDDGAPDGMTLDADGALWVAVHGSGTVRRYTPDGVLDQVVRVPVSMVTSCAFGGPDLTDLYITTMQYGMKPEAKQSQPLAGAIFHCRPGPRGRRANRFGARSTT